MEIKDFKTKLKLKIRKIGVAFGGGGARGFALLGAIKAFEENNLRFDYIAGTSVGSIVGALYSQGLPYKSLYEIAMSLKTKDIKKNKLPFMPSSTEGIQELITKYIGDKKIEELPIPFCAVAVDVVSGQELQFTSGELSKCVAGSCAVPGIFLPVEYQNYVLFDGGLANTIPASVPKKYGCDVVVGIDINPTRGSGTESEKYIDRVMASIGIVMKSTASFGQKESDILISPNLARFKSTKLDGAEEMIEEGYKATMAKMPEILSLFKRREKCNRRWFFWRRRK